MARKFPVLRKKEIYEGVADVFGIGLSPGRDTWSDEELIGYGSAVELTVLGDEAMIRECKIFLYGLHTKTSRRAMAATMLLVWNMRSMNPLEERIFPREDPGRDFTDKAATVFEEEGEVYTSDEIDMIVEGVTDFEIRRSCAFLAASTLRMFSKDVDSWVKAWDSGHFKNRYSGLMKRDFPLNTLAPQKSEVDFMYVSYQGNRVYLHTLGRILYSLADVEDTRQTKMFFEQPLSCTGMHIIPQFINAKLTMGCSTEDLVSALNMKQNEPTLMKVRDLISKPLGPDNRGTWKYARLFDRNAFSLLQDKYALDTVAILAHINSFSTESSNKSNPLDFVVLRQMGTKRLKYAKAVATNIWNHFKTKL